MRHALWIACLLAAGCATQTAQAPKLDRFVIADDTCGASRFAHLVGEEFAETYRASMPEDTRIVGRIEARTLEYTPARMNVVLDPGGRIVAIGCF